MSNIDLSGDVAAVVSLKSVPTILDIICRTTGMRFAAVARVTDDRWIACSVKDEVDFGLKPGGELPIETTLCNEIRQHPQVIVIDNVAEDATYRDHHTPRIYGLGSYISVPIHLADGSFFGTLCAIDPDPHRLNTPETLAMFDMFSNMIGVHISALDRLRVAEERLDDEQKSSALREQFIAVLGHDLRNPLAAISSAFQMLGRRALDANAMKIVQLGEASASRMKHLIDDVMDFARGRLGGGMALARREDAPVEATLRQVVGELASSAPDRIIDSTIEIGEPVDCDCSRLGQLVSNLLGNALTHGASDQPIRLSATTWGGVLDITVSNGGEPIVPAILGNIFAPFSRGTHAPNLEGLGLGLYIAHTIAVAHGGTLRVTSSIEETKFTFEMPTKPRFDV